MLYKQIKALYEKSRLETYRELFGRIREKDGSLSATEAYSADVIYLLKNPTVSTFAEALGISQPNATYKINSLASKGYVSRTYSTEDRRECRISVCDKFYAYYDTDYPFLTESVAKLGEKYTEEELALCERILSDLTDSLNEGND